MSLWRSQAYERLPELRKMLQYEKLVHCFFGQLVDELNSAYADQNMDLVKRIYQYIFHLLETRESSVDFQTVIAVSFLEHIPQHELIRNDIRRWFTRSELESMREIFTYHGTEEQYREMLESADSWKEKGRYRH